MTPRAVLPPRPASQRVFSIVLGMLAVLLPALVATSQIARPATPTEQARLLEGYAAAEQPANRATLAARVLYAATAPDRVEASTQRPEVTLAGARLAMLLNLLVVAALIFGLMSACRGGLAATFSCLALAGLPPVMDEGCVLRPEPLAATFALLGSVLLAAFTLMVVLRRRRGTLRRALLLTSLMVLTGASFGVAAAALTRASVLLLVPAGVVTLACAVQVWTWLRLLNRQRLTRRVLRPLAWRSWPWFGVAVLDMLATSMVLSILMSRGVLSAEPSASSFGLLPASKVSALLVVLLMGLGAVRLLLESGAHLSARRVHPSLVVVLFVALALMHHFLSGAGLCAFLPACAAAMLIGDGVATALALLVGVLLARAQPDV